MLGWTSATLSWAGAGSNWSNCGKPSITTPTVVKSGRMISPIHCRGLCDRRSTTAAAQSMDTANHAARNEMPYTPVNDATWMIGNIPNCEAPRKFHGKPDSSRACTISPATHNAAQDNAHISR